MLSPQHISSRQNHWTLDQMLALGFHVEVAEPERLDEVLAFLL
jgi:hypothetical protein